MCALQMFVLLLLLLLSPRRPYSQVDLDKLTYLFSLVVTYVVERSQARSVVELQSNGSQIARESYVVTTALMASFLIQSWYRSSYISAMPDLF